MNQSITLSLLAATVLLLLPTAVELNFADDGLGHALSIPSQRSRLDSLNTEKQYLTALRAADEMTFQNEFEKEFLLLLDAQHTQEYDSLSSLEARKAYIEDYWKASNPNPLLPENDWLADFLKRRAYARENFSAPEPPYYDDRGKYYLKYGKPRVRYEEKSSPGVFPNESWSYENVARNLLVHFVKDGPIFRETDNLLSFYENGKFRSPELNPQQWSKIVAQRAAVSPVFGRAYSKMQELLTARWHGQAFSNSHTALGIELQQPQTVLHTVYHQATVEVLQAKRERPSAAHDEIKAINKLEFTHDLAQFRGPQGTTRLEIALWSPLKKNILKKFSREAADTLRLVYRCLLRDQQFEPVAEDLMTSEFPVKLAAAAKLANAVGKLTVTALPRDSELTLQIKDVRQDKIGFSRQTFNIRDFSGRDLMLSDVQFLVEVAGAEQRRLLPFFSKLNTFVAPYPFEDIHKKIPLFCYFEIYNLKSSGMTDNYEVTYKIVSEKATAVSVSYTRPVTDDTAPELIAVDLSKVPKGKHRLEIVVADTKGAKIKTSMEKKIVIED